MILLTLSLRNARIRALGRLTIRCGTHAGVRWLAQPFLAERTYACSEQLR